MQTIVLNREQQEAVCYGKKCIKNGFESPPLLIIAGAGTGKLILWQIGRLI
jgi:superfamily I DNA/RNA helicase